MTKGKKLAGSAFSAALFSDKNLTRSKRGVGVALLSAALCSSASMAGVSGSVSAFNPLNAIGTGLSYAGSLVKGTINTARTRLCAYQYMTAWCRMRMIHNGEDEAQKLFTA